MFKTTRPFTEDEWTLVNDWLDHIYADFTGKVAEGRRMPADRVHDLARGRVWTGADAVANGLVDEIGGLDRAAAIARRRAGLPAAAPLRLYPRPTPLDRLRPQAGADAADAVMSAAALFPAVLPGASLSGSSLRGAAALAGLLAETWGPVWQLATRAGLPPYGPLILPGSWTFD
jgi:protease-4